VEEVSATVRTVCHGCRQVTQYRGDEGGIRPMVLPGSGTVWVDKMPGGMVEVACPVCGESDDPGWVPALVIPV
jgi:hypothetical protein